MSIRNQISSVNIIFLKSFKANIIRKYVKCKYDMMHVLFIW